MIACWRNHLQRSCQAAVGYNRFFTQLVPNNGVHAFMWNRRDIKRDLECLQNQSIASLLLTANPCGYLVTRKNPAKSAISEWDAGFVRELGEFHRSRGGTSIIVPSAAAWNWNSFIFMRI